ncbi:hypothetical protein JTE90_014993 [Oedothorax gibbosus]|uniref:Uncharacterized protein n=1 Tax=Oedothorax gibbosus TaxID=931172 RepID=A0AAV6V0A3_9ARAC|nr:hypothetical protein JTE90_014993 [Oedothorax gibbosus]
MEGVTSWSLFAAGGFRFRPVRWLFGRHRPEQSRLGADLEISPQGARTCALPLIRAFTNPNTRTRGALFCCRWSP